MNWTRHEWQTQLFNPLEKLQARVKSEVEILESLRDSKTIRTRIFYGKGAGLMRQYVVEINHIRIEMNTTFYPALDGAKKDNRAYIILIDTRNDFKYFSAQIRRTKSFFQNFLAWANALIDLAMNWPDDPVCGLPMSMQWIEEAERQVCFTCMEKNSREHKHVQRRLEIYMLDIPLSDETKIFFEELFSRKERYRESEPEHVPIQYTLAKKTVPIT